MHASGDRIFSLIVAALVIGGAGIFLSAALGLLAREGASLSHIAITQLLLGLVPGIIAIIVIRFLPPSLIMRGAVPFYALSVLLTLAVFIPGLSHESGGAARWIDLGPVTLQPAEFLKIGVVLMFARHLALAKNRLNDWRHGLLPYALIVGIPAVILLAQPNTSTVLVLGGATAALYFLAKAPMRDFLILGIVVLVALAALVATRPYLLDRVETFINPQRDALGQGYQIQQSLIAIGSGGLLGRGFGQSVQKFNYLPEPIGDSVFAVYGEEFGFVGAVLLVILFTAFAARGFAIAAEARDSFGSYTATGLTLVISLSAFLNIGAMLGILPLTGLPLPFVSHGGTALLAALISVGIILNVAAHRPKRRARA